MRKMNPKRQKNATEMESAPPVKRGILKTRTSSSGPSVRSSSSVKAVSRTAAPAKQASVPAEAQPHCGPSMMASTNNVIAHRRDHARPGCRSGARRTLGSRGIRSPPAMSVTIDDRHVDEEDRPVPEVLEQRPADDRPEGHGDARRRPPDPERLLPLGWVREDAREDGQAGREDEGRRHAHQRPGGDQRAGRVRTRPPRPRTGRRRPGRPAWCPCVPSRSPMPPPARSRPAKARL